MALTTVDKVRTAGGLDEPSDHLLFRDPDPAALDLRITNLIPVATAWLRSRAPVYYASADPDVQALFAHAESLLTLILLVEPLKARKVYGTHAPFDSETSDRYESLLDNEWPSQLEMLIGPYAVVEEPGETSYMPQFQATNAVVPAVGISELIQQAIDEASDWVPLVTPV